MKSLALLLGLVIATVGPASTADDKIAPDLLTHRSRTVDVIVEYKEAPTAVHHEKVLSRGGVLKRELGGAIRGAAYTIPASAIEDLARDSQVVYIAPDRPVKGLLNYTAAAVNASIAWTQYGLDGTGI